MKVTDDALMSAIFRQTIKHLPYRAIQRYVGARVAMANDSQFNNAIRQLAANRKNLKCGLAETQSLSRLRALVDSQHLLSDENRQLAEPGRTFWYWLPESIMRPVWDRTREIMNHCGLSDDRTPVMMPLSDTLADSVAQQLAEEFYISRRDTGTGSSWILKSARG